MANKNYSLPIDLNGTKVLAAGAAETALVYVLDEKSNSAKSKYVATGEQKQDEAGNYLWNVPVLLPVVDNAVAEIRVQFGTKSDVAPQINSFEQLALKNLRININQFGSQTSVKYVADSVSVASKDNSFKAA